MEPGLLTILQNDGSITKKMDQSEILTCGANTKDGLRGSL